MINSNCSGRSISLYSLVLRTGFIPVIVLLAGCAGGEPEQMAVPGDASPAVSGAGAYTLVFADEFDEGVSPSPARWNIETGYGPNNDGWGNNEWQEYTDSPDNVRVEGGNLVLSAQCPVAPCGVRDGSITSGKINTQGKFSFKYGKIEARIKPPVGKAAWPALWALGVNHPQVGWPRSGEIGFMEVHNFYSDDKTVQFMMHWCDEARQAPALCAYPEGWVHEVQSISFPGSVGDDFHVLEAEWDARRIVGKVDGTSYFSLDIDPASMEEFLQEFFLIMNVAMGGKVAAGDEPPDGSETFPQTMLVDYIRVYQRLD